MAKWLVGGISVSQKVYEQVEVNCRSLLANKDKTAKEALYQLYSRVNDLQGHIQGLYRDMLKSLLDDDGNILDKFSGILRKSLIVDEPQEGPLQWESQVEVACQSLLSSEDTKNSNAIYRLYLKAQDPSHNIEEPYLGILQSRELLDENGNLDDAVHSILEEGLILDSQDNSLHWISKTATTCKALLSSKDANHRAAIYELYLKIQNESHEISSLHMKILGSMGFLSRDTKMYGKLYYILGEALVKQDIFVRWMSRAEVNCRDLCAKGEVSRVAVYELGLQLKDPSRDIAQPMRSILEENQLVDRTGRRIDEVFESLKGILVPDSQQEGLIHWLTRGVSRLEI